MPNHITNWVEISGDEKSIAKLKADTIKQFNNNEQPAIGSEIYFDFNGIIPMPKELNETISPTEVVATQAEADKINLNYAKDDSPFKSDQTIKAITKAEQERRMSVYGADSWYEWAIANWSTKWGAYEAKLLLESPTKLVLQFNTAWSPPSAIFDKLTEMGLNVNCFWQDEDVSNFGEYGSPYDVFDINHPPVEVEYSGGEQ
jgi:hypothetical protein